MRYAARAQPLDWLSDRHDHMSTVPVSIDLPRHDGRPGLPGECCAGSLGPGLATSELDAGPAATEVATSAVEHAAAEHAWSELARPQGWFRLSVADGAAVRRIVGDRDHRYPRRPRHAPLEVVADGCAVEHNDVDHNPARNGDADRVVPAEDRSREDRLWASGECRQGEQQQLPAVGDWYAGCTD